MVANRAERYRGFDVIKDKVEIDEVINGDDSIDINDCEGFVLIEVPKPSFGGLTSGEIFNRAFELADGCKPYGVAFINWDHTYEADDRFIRFTVQGWEAISKEQRQRDADEIRAEERAEARS